MNDVEITLIQAERATDLETLVEYCKQGAIENMRINGGSLDEWCDGGHLIETYLDHNKVADKHTMIEVEFELSAWLRKNTNSAEAIHAMRQVDEEDRVLVIRKEQRPSERWYWCSVKDGGFAGTNVNRYVRFLSEYEAKAAAHSMGYTVVSE